MPRYRILINGRNFLLEVEGSASKHGFYQTHWVEAKDSEAAQAAAIMRVRKSEDLKAATQNESTDAPMIFIEECEQILNFDSASANPTGLALYLEEAEA